MAVVSLILGIVSIVLAFLPPISLLGLAAGVIGTILGAVSRKREPGSLGTGGLITSIVGTALTIVIFGSCLACMVRSNRMISDSFKKPDLYRPVDDLSERMKQMEKESRKGKSR